MRSTLAVIVSFVAMSIFVLAVSLAPWFLFGVDRVLLPGRYDGTFVLNTYSVLAGALGAVLAGCLCAKISRSKIAVFALAAVCFIGGMGNAIAQSNKPIPGPRQPGLNVMQVIKIRKEPAWFVFLMPIIGAGEVLLVGRWQLKKDDQFGCGAPAD